MAFHLKNRVRETSTTTGTGAYTLGGAQANIFVAFNAVYANGDTFSYAAIDRAGNGWETGIGTWNTGNTISRTLPLESSNGGAAVNWGAGTRDIYVTALGSRILTTDFGLLPAGQIPLATGAAVGGVKVGARLTMTGDTLSADLQGSVNVQSFVASGTWTKPAGYAAGSRVLLQGWGGGASGGRGTSSPGGGGGGGGYNFRWCLLSDLGATETITIAAGGAARTTNGVGNTGGNTTIGGLLAAYGGHGGTAGECGGNGGGQLSAGTALEPGTPFILSDIFADTQGATTPNPNFKFFRQGQGGQIWTDSGTNNQNKPGQPAFMHGGGGAMNFAQSPAGGSVWGGGGGGAASATTGGASEYAGDGGVGASSGNGGNGVQPGGGGGHTATGTTSGAGGNGQAIVTVFPI